jgi:hypothetical protein
MQNKYRKFNALKIMYTIDSVINRKLIRKMTMYEVDAIS